MTSEQAIENILKEQLRTYKALHEILTKERKCLVDMDMEKVEEVSKEKDTVIMRLRLFEEERQRLINRFVEDNGITGDINLRELGRITGNDMFRQLRSQMLSLLQGIEEMNKFNSSLINRSMAYFQVNNNFFRSFKKEDMSRTRGVLLSKET
ncbi:MAG: flagellar protein FlgN [Nitrospirota bacterium]|nr:flagellar protein FlgN [Nitrospirota bacterium]